MARDTGIDDWVTPSVPRRPAMAALPAGANQSADGGVDDWVLPEEQPGLLARIGDMFTGSLRTEFPDVPEFGAALTAAAHARGEGTPAGLQVLGSLVTPDPKAQVDILRQGIPDLEDKTDRYGNVMLRAPAAGVTDWTYLNAPGLSARDVGEFLIPTVATAPIGGPLFGLGRTVAARVGTGVLAGAGSSVAADAIAVAAGSEQGVDPERAVVSGLIGGALGPVGTRVDAAGTAKRAATPAPAATAGDDLLAAAGRLDVPVPNMIASDNVLAQRAGQTMRSVPIAGDPVVRAWDDTIEALGDAAERTARGAGSGSALSAGERIRGELADIIEGGTRTATNAARQQLDDFERELGDIVSGYGAGGRVGAGESMRGGLLDWIRGRSQDDMNAAYAQLRQLIDLNRTWPLSATQRAVRKLSQADIKSASRDGQAAISLVQEAIERPGGLTFDGIRELRTRINDRLNYNLGEHSVSQRALHQLKAALSEDLEFAVQRAGVAKRGSTGQRALAAFKEANERASAIFERRNELTRLIGAEGTSSPESIVERLLTMASAGRGGDITRLAQVLRIAGPAARRELASAALRQMGRTADGFSVGRFRTAWGNLSPNGRTMLFGLTGEQRQRIEALLARAPAAESVQDALRSGTPAALERAMAGQGSIDDIARNRTALERVVGRSAAASPEAIVERLTRMARTGGGEDYLLAERVRDTVSRETWDDLVSAVVLRLGRDGAEENFSPDRFLTAFNRLTPNGRNVLFGRNPRVQQALADIARIAERFKEVQRFANPSGTAQVGAGITLAGSIFVWPGFLSTLAGLAGGRLLANLLARPATARQVANVARAQVQVLEKPTTARLQALHAAERALSQSVASLTGGAAGSEPAQVPMRGGAAQPERPDLAGNQTYRALLQRGVSPAEAAAAIDARNPQLVARMLQGSQPTSASGSAAGRTGTAPVPQSDLAGNVTYNALLTKGVHPENAQRAIGNPDLAIAMLRSPERFRDAGTPAERLIETRREMGVEGGIRG